MTSGFEFESEVRRIARAIWPKKAGAGASVMLRGRERDMVFEEEYVTHYIECTTSRKLDKAKNDVAKLVRCRDEDIKRGRASKLWFITKDEPTADQRAHAKRKGVDALSLQQFSRKLIDGDGYLSARREYPFGSAEDVKNDTRNISELKYIRQRFFEDGEEKAATAEDIAELIAAGEHVVLLGDFGVGKSMAYHELFRILATKYYKSDGPLPVALNLRDHWGQEDYSEALMRHCQRVGFDGHQSVARALNTGLACLLLDGFDEIATVRSWGRETVRLRKIRRESLRLIAVAIRSLPENVGILITGRPHFFDDEGEMLSALGLSSRSARRFTLSDFTEKQALEMTRSVSSVKRLPAWLPKRPLLLATLLARDLVSEDLLSDALDQADAWNKLIDRICTREAKIHAQLQPEAIRLTLEHLASRARDCPDGLGPLGHEDMARAFARAVGDEPDDAARALMMRLPGLSGRDQQRGTRSFIDDSLTDALRAGDVQRFVQNPYSNPGAKGWYTPLGWVGQRVALREIEGWGDASEQLFVTAAREACTRWHAPTLSLDIVALTSSFSEAPAVSFANLRIIEGFTSAIDLSARPSLQDLTLISCCIDRLSFPASNTTAVQLNDCTVSLVEGVSGMEDLPSFVSDMLVDRFSEAETNAAVLSDESLPIGLRVAISILRKVYEKAGSGRREDALFRGMNQHAKGHVVDTLEALQGHGLVRRDRHKRITMWFPVPSAAARAHSIVAEYRGSQDPLVQQLRGE